MWPFPRRETTEHLYRTDYFAQKEKIGGYVDYRSAEALKRLSFAEILPTLAGIRTTPGRLLDVGAAYGTFLDVAREAGWRTEGIELNEAAAADASSRGHKMVCGAFPDALSGFSGEFDVVTMFDVVEHLEDPLRASLLLRERIAAGGAVVMVTPNFSGRYRRLLGRNWPHFKPAEHLWYFRPDSIRALLLKAQFQEVAVRRFYKTVSVAYLAKAIGKQEGLVGRVARLLNRVVGPIRDRPIRLYMDEMIVTARR
ncbi:MAG TPA: class I SAM-dependent methyltransferase [Candidatus Polarisedimenticolia bacterium]|nr:class I SAM-dependent methyltransferase [Candidatus Polarisedimenticolia bacterium]